MKNKSYRIRIFKNRGTLEIVVRIVHRTYFSKRNLNEFVVEISGAFNMLMNNLKESDSEVYNLILREVDRIENGVELIPSENFVSRAVMQAMSSVFTNKYSEGYPKRRYYGGQEFVDQIEKGLPVYEGLHLREAIAQLPDVLVESPEEV